MTRKSIIQLARRKGFTVEEANIPATEAMEADEVFTVGTAVVVQSVGSLTYKVPACLAQLEQLQVACSKSSCTCSSDTSHLQQDSGSTIAGEQLS